MPALERFSSWHVGVAAEACAAVLFARCGMDVSVQYGANQPGYDLIVARGDKLLKVSVKGSKDWGWGLTQSYLKEAKTLAAGSSEQIPDSWKFSVARVEQFLNASKSDWSTSGFGSELSW
jgi:hypothetical protein